MAEARGFTRQLLIIPSGELEGSQDLAGFDLNDRAIIPSGVFGNVAASFRVRQSIDDDVGCHALGK